MEKQLGCLPGQTARIRGAFGGYQGIFPPRKYVRLSEPICIKVERADWLHNLQAKE
jgi:hypothetical protein